MLTMFSKIKDYKKKKTSKWMIANNKYQPYEQAN